MEEKKRFVYLILIMLMVSIIVSLIIIVSLYRQHFDDERQRLRTSAQSTARLIEAVARYDIETHKKYFPAGQDSTRATKGQILDAYKHFKGFRETGEFVLGQKDGNNIVFLLRKKFGGVDFDSSIPFESKLAEPMRKALSLESGTMLGLDYKGTTVLAAYEPVAVLNLGIVTKIDVSEIKSKFWETALAGFGISIFIVILGAFIFIKISNSIFNKIIQYNRELKQKQEDLNKAIETATKANQSKSNFLASMSHELRTPLNAIIGFSQVLENQYFGKLNRKQVNYVKKTIESGDHLLSLIDEILNLSNMETGEIPFKPEFLNINDLVEKSLMMIREKAFKQGIEITFKGGKKLNATKIYADEKKIQQVLNNLNSNAVKFTRDGGKISLSTQYISNYGELNPLFKRPVTKEQNAFPAVVICVEDTGPGIPPELTEKIFENFFQANQEYSGKTPGSGLGLSLSKKIVEMHNGKIWVESQGEGKGSTFIFTIPFGVEKTKQGTGRIKPGKIF
jgi:signal transduction histidine kinase